MFLKVSFTASILICLSLTAFSQLKLGNNPSSIQNSSILELESTSMGLLIPRLTTIQRDSISSSPSFDGSISQGLLIFNTDLQSINIFDTIDGGRWYDINRSTIPYQDTNKALSGIRSGDLGDIIVDPACDCIMFRDSSDIWRPLLANYSQWQGVFTSNDSFYFLVGPSLNGDTISFGANSKLGLGLLEPLYSVDIISRDSLFIRVGEDSNCILTVKRVDSSLVLNSKNHTLTLTSAPLDSNRSFRLDNDGSIDFSAYGRGVHKSSTPAYILGVDSAGNLLEMTGFTAMSSDIRLKKNIQSLSVKSSDILKINGISYNWKPEVHPVKRFDSDNTYGVIAQEIELYFPELVSTDPQGYKMVDYQGLIPVLIESLKSQNEKVTELENRIQTLEERLNKFDVE